MITQEKHGYMFWNINMTHLVFSSVQGTHGELEWRPHQNIKDPLRRWICFEWIPRFLQNPWNTKAIHYTVYTSTDRCFRKKEYHHMEMAHNMMEAKHLSNEYWDAELQLLYISWTGVQKRVWRTKFLKKYGHVWIIVFLIYNFLVVLHMVTFQMS